METDDDLSVLEYSPTIEKIVSRPPTWTVRYANYVLVGFLSALLLLTFLIRYNDIVEGTILVTTTQPIVSLRSKTSGEISKLLIKNGDTVVSNQVLAVLKTTASYDDIILVKNMLNLIEDRTQLSINEINSYYPSNLKLGTVQKEYLNFFLKHNELLVNDSLAPYAKKTKNVEVQLSNQESLLRSRRRQLGILINKSKILKKNVDRSKVLLSKGVISAKEHEETTKDYLEFQNQKEILISGIFEKEIELNRIGNSVDESELNSLTFGTSSNQIYRQSFQNLENAITRWENNFLIKTPIAGIANSHNVWEVYQNLEEGEIIFSIVPFELSSGLGIAKIPVERFAKLKKGQKVVVKLSSYPYQQYGHLDGIVSGMSSIPDQENQTYTIFVNIESFTTSFGTEIVLNQQMIGKAQVVTEELSLAKRLFYGARKIFDPNK